MCAWNAVSGDGATDGAGDPLEVDVKPPGQSRHARRRGGHPPIVTRPWHHLDQRAFCPSAPERRPAAGIAAVDPWVRVRTMSRTVALVARLHVDLQFVASAVCSA